MKENKNYKELAYPFKRVYNVDDITIPEKYKDFDAERFISELPEEHRKRFRAEETQNLVDKP
jgi:hypothetical protein